jgi:two-component system sensor histidine kinase CreC
MRIRSRLILTFLVLAGIGFYALVDWMVDELRPRYMETMEESLVDFAHVMASVLSVEMAQQPNSNAGLHAAMKAAEARRFKALIFNVTKDRVDLRLYVTDEKGIVVFDSDGGGAEGQDYSRWNDVHLTLNGKYGVRATREIPDDASTTVLYIAAPIYKDGEIAGVLTVCKPTNSVTRFMDLAQRNIGYAGLIAALGVILVGVLASIWITRPIQALTNYANAIRDGRRPSLPKVGGGEVGDLRNAFEEMRDALEGKLYVENYVQTLTHEMKSPLSAVLGAAELLEEDMSEVERKRFMRNIKTETVRINSLVERLLLLTSLESRKTLVHPETIDIKSVVDDVCESQIVQCDAHKVSLDVVIPDGLRIRGERFLIRHAFANVLQNAIEFSSEGSVVRITGQQQADGCVSIFVDDSGPGIPLYATERVFERFFSLQRPRTGKKSSGLGLAIAAETAELHGGHISLCNRDDGGARAALIFPAAS